MALLVGENVSGTEGGWRDGEGRGEVVTGLNDQGIV